MSSQGTATPAPELVYECQVRLDLVHGFISIVFEEMVLHVLVNLTAKFEARMSLGSVVKILEAYVTVNACHIKHKTKQQ